MKMSSFTDVRFANCLIRDDQEGITAITWRNDGKIRDIFRANDVAEPRKELSFDYSPHGHLLSRKVCQPGSDSELLHVAAGENKL